MGDLLMPPASVVLLSPHSDDACFSATMLARTARVGVVLTLFARSAYTAGTPCDLSSVNVSRVTELRRAEDMAFSAACGLEFHSLDLDDAPLRGVQPFQAPVPDAVPYVETPLMAWIDRLPPSFSGGLLAAPAGIGRHVDHIAVRDAVIRNLKSLTRRFRVCFYEDLHYASDPEKLSDGQAALLGAVPSGTMTMRVQIPLSDSDAAIKLSMIGIYASQLRSRPTSLASFTPGGASEAPHEAIWVVSVDPVSAR